MEMDTLLVMIRIFYEIGSKLSYFNVSDNLLKLNEKQEMLQVQSASHE